jgi:Tfp pilus assembly protein FimT
MAANTAPAPCARAGRTAHSMRGHAGSSLIEVLAATALMALMAAMAVPIGLSRADQHRLDAAARYIRGRCFEARAEAIKRSAFVAIRFEPDAAGDAAFQLFLDGNRNGVRTRDIDDGIDRAMVGKDRLGDHFPGIRFGVSGGLTGIAAGDTLSEGDDPIQIGSTDLLSFSPDGSATAGTLYIRSDRGQRAVRILGATGRTRLLSYWFPERRWNEQ